MMTRSGSAGARTTCRRGGAGGGVTGNNLAGGVFGSKGGGSVGVLTWSRIEDDSSGIEVDSPGLGTSSNDEISSPGVGGGSANASPRPQSAKYETTIVPAASAPNRLSFRFSLGRCPGRFPGRFPGLGLRARARVAICFQFPKALLMTFSIESFLKLVAIAVRA
jgi:hypothetical protein